MADTDSPTSPFVEFESRWRSLVSTFRGISYNHTVVQVVIRVVVMGLPVATRKHAR